MAEPGSLFVWQLIVAHPQGDRVAGVIFARALCEALAEAITLGSGFAAYCVAGVPL